MANPSMTNPSTTNPSIPDLETTIHAFEAAWNERDATRRAALLEQCLADDVQIFSGGQTWRGRREVDAAIRDFHQRLPAASGGRSSQIDAHGDVFRYVATLHSPGLPAPLEFTDAGQRDEQGRICLLMTFRGAAPQPLTEP